MTDIASEYSFNAGGLGLEQWEDRRIHVLSLMLFLGRHCFGFEFSDTIPMAN